MGERDMVQFLERWNMDVPGVRRRMILAPVPRERWYALWLLTQGWTAQATAEALERDPHTIGRWASAFGEGGPAALIFEQTGGSHPPLKGDCSGVLPTSSVLCKIGFPSGVNFAQFLAPCGSARGIRRTGAAVPCAGLFTMLAHRRAEVQGFLVSSGRRPPCRMGWGRCW